MAVDELNRKIRGDWFEIREKYDNLYELEDIFAFTVPELSVLVADLRISVEEGVTEYKQSKFRKLATYLESLQYDARGLDELADRSRDFAHVLYVSLIQRLIATGAISLKASESSEEDEARFPEMGMKEILEEIQERMKLSPELKQHQAVKNIFMQVNIYKRELGNMQKLAPNIPAEKRPGFLANFKRSFEQITDKIRDQYHLIQREDVVKAAKDVISTNPLKNHDLSELGTVFDNQAKEFSVVRSTLRFAADERYKTSDILSSLKDRQERIQLLLAS